MMKKSKYQKYFHCFIVCKLVPYAFWFSYQQNIVTTLISAGFTDAALIRGEALIRGRCLFQCRYPNVWRLLAGGPYLRPSAYQRKLGMQQIFRRTPIPKCDFNKVAKHTFSEHLFLRTLPTAASAVSYILSLAWFKKKLCSCDVL